MVLALARSMRPKQWTKNLLVFAGYLFTLSEHHQSEHAAWLVIVGFVLFCLTSGAVYIFNDVLDAKRDRHHPIKRKRPIASGQVPIPVAVVFAAAVMAGSLFAAFRLDQMFGVVLEVYIVLTSAYSFALKHFVIIDLLTIAAGFVMRAVAGAVIIHVEISPWLLLCTTLLALFLGLAKRRNEIVSLEEGATKHRKILDEYSIEFLDQMINITAATALMAYALYTFASFSKTASQHPYMMITIPFVIYGVFRYLFLIHTKNAGGHPEQVLLDDKPLLFNLILWAGTVAVIIKWNDIAPIFDRLL